MTEDQKRMFDDLKPLQQKVAINVISGMSNIDAYIKAGGNAKTKESKEASVSQILSNLKVKAFLDSMKQVQISDAIMSREEMMERLTRLSRANLPVRKDGTLDIVDLSDEQLEALEQVQISDGGLKVKNYSQLAAMKQLAELAGYNAASKHDHTSSDGSMSPRKNLDDFYG